MKIFLTGGSGFVGREVARQLLAGGNQVTVLSRTPQTIPDAFPQGFGYQKGDLLDPESFKKSLEGCHAVIHMVGVIVETGRSSFYQIHVEGTRGLLQAAKKAGVERFIYMSALGSGRDASSRYHQTKFEAETLVKESGLDWTIFRPSVIFGPKDKFVNRLAGIIKKAPFIPVIGTGLSRVQPVSVEDVGSAFCLSVGNPVSSRKMYVLGGPDSFSYEEIFRLIASVLKIKKKVVHIPTGLVYPAVVFGNIILSNPPLTPEQLIMMGEDNTCDPTEAVGDFGLSLKSFKSGIREILIVKT